VGGLLRGFAPSSETRRARVGPERLDAHGFQIEYPLYSRAIFEPAYVRWLTREAQE
jgi:hypothetical protein